MKASYFFDSLYTIKSLTIREFKIFFKDKASLFFCFMAPITFLLLYLLFLRGVCLNGINMVIGNFISTELDLLVENELRIAASGFIDSWMFSGVLSLASISVGLTANNILVTDKEKGISKDLASTPTRTSVVTISYYLFNFLINIFISVIIFLVTLIFLASISEFHLRVADVFGLFGIIVLSSILNTLIFTFFARFFKTSPSYGSFTAVMNAIVGFLIGAYIPTSIMPIYLQNLTNLFPGTFIANLFRTFFTRGSLNNIETILSTNNVENSKEIIEQLKIFFNSDTTIFNTYVPTYVLVLSVLAFVLVFFILNIIMDTLSSKKRKIK